MTAKKPQHRWRVTLSLTLCGAIAALITVQSTDYLHAQAPAGKAPAGEALFTSAQAVAGKVAYQRSCASCHGAQLDDGDSAPPLRGASFLSQHAGQASGARD